MNIKPRRADSYEAQLSDGELIALHEALLSGRVTLAKIRAEAPKWRAGHLTGRPPSEATLSNIRAELVLKATLQANEVTTDTVVAELKQQVPGLKDEELAEYGHRVFSLLALRQQDAKTWVALRKTQKDAADLKLRVQQFHRETCELFLKWAADERARNIAENGARNGEKIAALGALMFGEDWKP